MLEVSCFVSDDHAQFTYHVGPYWTCISDCSIAQIPHRTIVMFEKMVDPDMAIRKISF